MKSSRRLFVADPYLDSYSGHSFGYAVSLAEAAAARGLPTVIFGTGALAAAAGATPGAVLGVFGAPSGRIAAAGLAGRLVRIIRRLPGGTADDVVNRLQGLWGSLRRTTRPAARDNFGVELSSALRHAGGGHADILLLPTISSAKLATLEADLAPTAIGELLVVLRQSPGEMDHDPAAPSISSVLDRLARRYGERLAIFADTAPLAAMYSEHVRQPVHVVPPPVPFVPPKSGPVGAPPRIIFAGVARHERGYQLLPGLITPLLDRALFTVQHAPVAPDAPPSVIRANHALRQLADAGRIDLIERALAPAAYLDVLGSADLVLLPYLGDAYGARSSGVLAEALAFGIPAVIPAGGWMEQAAGRSRSVAFSDSGQIAQTIRTALEHLSDLTQSARAQAPAWLASHSPDALLTALIGPDRDASGKAG